MTRRRRSQAGQVLVLSGLMLILVLTAGGIAVDGGNGLYQFRMAQNAADFASLASTRVLGPACSRQSSTISGQSVINVMTDVIGANAPDALSSGGSWSAYYTDEHGQVLSAVSSGGDAPLGACGTEVIVNPRFGNFLEGLIGFSTLSTTATAKSLALPAIPPITAGIAALAPKGGHTILGGGAGDAKFIVIGNIFDNSAGTNAYSDTVDTFGTSQVWIDGQIESVATGSFDGQYQNTIVSGSYTLNDGSYGTISTNCEAVGSGNHSPIYFNSAQCPPPTGSSSGYGGLPQITDPLAQLLPPDPSLDGCDTNGYVMPQYAGGTISSGTLEPGEYTGAVIITGSVTFADCPDGSPGIYYFDNGLAVCPADRDTVIGTNVMLYAAGTGSAGSAGSCGQTTDAMTFSPRGSYTDSSLDASVSFSAPTSGPFKNLVVWVAHSLDSGTDGNLGMTDDPYSFGSVTLNGVVYAHSDKDNPPNGNAPDTFESGYPVNTGPCTVGGSPPGNCAGGTVAVNGYVVVDKFFTGGTAQTTVNYEALQLGGSGGYSARLVQ